jgi:hypothetical protein
MRGEAADAVLTQAICPGEVADPFRDGRLEAKRAEPRLMFSKGPLDRLCFKSDNWEGRE